MKRAALLFALAACTAGTPDGDDSSTGDDSTTGGDDSGTGDGLGPAGFLEQFASAECTFAHGCQAEFPADAGITFEEAFGASVTECEAMAAEFYQPDGVRDAVNRGTIVYDRAAAEACLAQLDFGTCQTYFMGTFEIPEPCFDALVGQIADGAACAIDFECSGAESWCDPTSQKCGPAPTN
jgi:hypothetical protein